MDAIKVTHKITGEKFTIYKDSGSIVVCNLLKPYLMPGTRVLIDKAIIRKENLNYENN